MPSVGVPTTAEMCIGPESFAIANEHLFKIADSCFKLVLGGIIGLAFINDDIVIASSNSFSFPQIIKISALKFFRYDIAKLCKFFKLPSFRLPSSNWD
jgi:hypothetical protein